MRILSKQENMEVTIFSTLAKFTLLVIFTYYNSVSAYGETKYCVKKQFGWDSVVCVCNATYCDEIGEIKPIPDGSFTVYTSSKAGLRFQQKTTKMSCCPRRTNKKDSDDDLQCKVDLRKVKQSVIGFGGAFTDAAGININSLSSKTKDNLMSAYFSSQGIEYTTGRVPMAATDFSTHFYTYQDDPNDSFRLQPEDFKYKIPLIRQANAMSKRGIRYFASPWAAPLWMRVPLSDEAEPLLPNNYQLWAQYFVDFFLAYKTNNLTFWGVTPQNEPFFASYIAEFIPNASHVFTPFTPLEMTKFMVANLKPTLKASEFSNIKILAFDDNLDFYNVWHLVNSFAKLNNESFCQSFDGFAFHWYSNKYINYHTTLDGVYGSCPGHFLLSTEACAGVMAAVRVKLGYWHNAEDYAHDIIKDLQNWASGWVDWNLALNMDGGPNWLQNFVDSSIIVDASKDIFYKQPMYYAMGHFSKFLPPGYGIVDVNCNCEADKDIEMVAAVKQDKNTVGSDVVVVVLNRGNSSRTLDFNVVGGNDVNLCMNIPAKSIQTYIWNNPRY